MPRNKRRESIALEVPKRPKLGERSERPEKGEVKSRCQSLSEALHSVELPEDCKAMLLEAIPLTLGVPVKERDQRQVAVAGFIGEVLKEIEVKLLQDFIDSKLSSKEEVLSAQLRAQRCAEQVKLARQQLEGAEEQLALRLSEDDVAKDASRAVATRLAALQQAQQAAEEQRKAKQQERELCQAVRQRLQPDEGDQSGPALDPKAVAALCGKLELEDSLLSTLPLILQKSHAARSYLERAGSKLLCEALEKHLDSLSKTEDTASDSAASASDSADAASLEALRAKQLEAEKSHQEKVQAVGEARKCVEDFQAALAKCQAGETQALAQLQDVKQSAGMSHVERQLSKLRKGAALAYQQLEGPMVANHTVELLEEKLRQLDQQLHLDAEKRRLAEPGDMPRGRGSTPPPERKRRLRPALPLEESEPIDEAEQAPEPGTRCRTSPTDPSMEPTMQPTEVQEKAELGMKDEQPANAPQEAENAVEETVVPEDGEVGKEEQPVNAPQEAEDAVEETVVQKEAEVEMKDIEPTDAPHEEDNAVEETVVQKEAEVEMEDIQPADAPQEEDNAVEETVVQKEAEVEMEDIQPADAPQEEDNAVEETVVQEEAEVEMEDVEAKDAPQEGEDVAEETVVAEVENQDAVTLEVNPEDAEMNEQTGVLRAQSVVEADDQQEAVEKPEGEDDVSNLQTLQAAEESQELATTEVDEVDTEGAEDKDSQESMEVPERPMLKEEDGAEEDSVPPTQLNEETIAGAVEETDCGGGAGEAGSEGRADPMEESFPETLPDSPPPRPEAELIADTPEPPKAPTTETTSPSCGSPHSLFGYATMLLGLNGTAPEN